MIKGIRQVGCIDLLVRAVGKQAPHRISIDSTAATSAGIRDSASTDGVVRIEGYVGSEIERPVVIDQEQVSEDFGDIPDHLFNALLFISLLLDDGDVIQGLY